MSPEKRPKRQRIRAGPTLGKKQVSVSISIGFPIMVVGLALLISAYLTGGAFFWILGAALAAVGVMLFTSNKVF